MFEQASALSGASSETGGGGGSGGLDSTGAGGAGDGGGSGGGGGGGSGDETANVGCRAKPVLADSMLWELVLAEPVLSHAVKRSPGVVKRKNAVVAVGSTSSVSSRAARGGRSGCESMA